MLCLPCLGRVTKQTFTRKLHNSFNHCYHQTPERAIGCRIPIISRFVFVTDKHDVFFFSFLTLQSYRYGPSCSKLTTSSVNVSLKFQTLISNIHQYFLLKKCEKLLHCKLLHCKSYSHFFNKKYQCSWL